MKSWFQHRGPEDDVVVSSRVRLARNLKNYPFSNKINDEQAKALVNSIKDAVLNTDSLLKMDFNYISMADLSDVEREVLIERHLISHDLIRNKEKSGVIFSKDEKQSVMINEEDHIRIQAILPGLQINKAWETSNKMDDLIENTVEYAYSENFGYLSSCPTNVGTGIRASVMVHIPALNMIGYVNGILSTIGKLGIAVRGIYGEGTQALGNMFQISNQITLGQSEEDIISNLNGVINQIVEKERMARNKILKENSFQLEDKIFRSLGTSTHARILSSSECMNLLSDIKLGINLGIINNVSLEDINELIVLTQPASLQKAAGKILDGTERDSKRAEIIRKKLMKKEG